MFILRVLPVFTSGELFQIQYEPFVNVDAMGDISVIDFNTERLISASDCFKVIAEGELRDIATGPSVLTSFLWGQKLLWVVSADVPLFRLLKHVFIGLHWVALFNLDAVLATKLCEGVLLEGTMVLVEVVKAVVDLWVL